MKGLIIFLVILIGFILWYILFSSEMSKHPEKHKNKTKPSPFDYPEYGFNKMATFSKTQLIGGERFLNDYKAELISLYRNDAFMSFIHRLRKIVDGGELTGTKEANKAIANAFFYQKINDVYPDANRIAQAVKKYGTQASAHISIYYAMFILDEEL